MKKFEEGKTYHGTSMVDYDSKIRVKVLKRTPSFLTAKITGWPVDKTRFKIKTGSINGRKYEYIVLANYSLAPIISAENTLY